MATPSALPDNWPSYPCGPRDSIFALGVASTTFTELESTQCFIFGTIFGLSRDDQIMIVAKIGNEAAVVLMQQKLDDLEWPGDFKDLTSHFLRCFGVCNDNRAALAHSGFALTGPSGDTILFKTTKKGETHISAPTLQALRDVADGMHKIAEYGRALGNAINMRLSGDPPIFSGAAFPVPEKPPLSRKLEYRGRPDSSGEVNSIEPICAVRREGTTLSSPELPALRQHHLL